MKHQTMAQLHRQMLETFNDRHQEEMKSIKDIIHVYAEPHFTGEDSDFESDIWAWNEVESWFYRI